MRGFLKSREGVFLLAASTTTIGREGCDLVLQGADGDCVHAIIEYLEEDGSFMLQDVNSVHGVYVNDCTVRKTVVRLEPNDMICFGYNGIPYEFLTELKQQRSAGSTQCPIKDSSGHISFSTGLAQLRSSFMLGDSRTLVCQQNVEENKSDGNEITDSAGWISGPRKILADRVNPCAKLTPDNDINLSELQTQLECLQHEVKQLSMFEAECVRKDDLIEQLREEITNLQNFVRLIEVDRCPFCQRDSLNSCGRLLQLEPQSEPVVASAADTESSRQHSPNVAVIADISSSLQPDFQSGQINGSNGTMSTLSPVFSSMLSNVGEQDSELTRKRDACSLSISLACQMQRDMASKDDTISRMATETESLKEKLLEQDIQISVLEDSLQRFDQNKLTEDVDIQMRDREIALLRHKLKAANTFKVEKSSQINALTKELAKCKISMETERQAAKKLRAEVDTLKVKNQDLERLERLARIDIEQLSKRLEKLRSRAVQTAFAGGSSKAADKLISDDDLLAMLKKCADERGETPKKLPTSQEAKRK